MNSADFLVKQQIYFTGSYDQFCAFGGPCVHFHRECIRAGEAEFLGDRHLEMLYATLTAWGMHRMGDSETTKTKLTNWDVFSSSLRANANELERFRSLDLLALREPDYDEALASLSSCYRAMKLSISGATIVVNSKALFHLLPRLIPPIDRQYTVRFFNQPRVQWRDSKGKFKTIMLPAGIDGQFQLFQAICNKVKRLADRVDRSLLDTEMREHGVSAPKAIDNAIVAYVRANSVGSPPTS
jgi:hypothetical protein